MKKYIKCLSASFLVTMAVAGAAYSQDVSVEPAAEAASVAIEEAGVPGGVYVDAIKLTATVTAIDAEKRKITIAGQDGSEKTFIAGPQVVNFGQIQVGDQITVALMSELVIYMRKAGEPSPSEDELLMARAAEGEKPAGIIAGTTEITAVVESIDLEKHQGTLKMPDGSSKTVTARKDVDLTTVAVGDEVVIKLTSAVAVAVETP